MKWQIWGMLLAFKQNSSGDYFCHKITLINKECQTIYFMMTLLLQQLRNIGHFCKDTESHLHNPLLANRCLLVLGIGFSFLFCSGLVSLIFFAGTTNSATARVFGQWVLFPYMPPCNVFCHLALGWLNFFFSIAGDQWAQRFWEIHGLAWRSQSITRFHIYKGFQKLQRALAAFALELNEKKAFIT